MGSVAEDAFEKAGHGGSGRSIQDTAGRAVGEDSAVADESDLVGDLTGETHLVGDQDEGPPVGAQGFDGIEDFPGHFGIEG